MDTVPGTNMFLAVPPNKMKMSFVEVGEAAVGTWETDCLVTLVHVACCRGCCALEGVSPACALPCPCAPSPLGALEYCRCGLDWA